MSDSLLNDGTPFLCRYLNGEDIELILALVMKINDKSDVITFDTKDIKDLKKKVIELEEKIQEITQN